MAVLVNYLHPATGTQPPVWPSNHPTNDNSVVVVLTGVGATDSQTIISHNLSINVSNPLGAFPLVVYEPLDPSAFTAEWYTVSQAPDFTVINKTNLSQGALTNSQVKITISRPHTLFR